MGTERWVVSERSRVFVPPTVQHLLCRASEIWTFSNVLVHPEFCLTTRDLAFFAGAPQLAWHGRRAADRVEVIFRASESENKRLGAIVTRTIVTVGEKNEGRKELRGAGSYSGPSGLLS